MGKRYRDGAGWAYGEVFVDALRGGHTGRLYGEALWRDRMGRPYVETRMGLKSHLCLRAERLLESMKAQETWRRNEQMTLRKQKHCPLLTFLGRGRRLR